jgi:hypothetical protein
MDNDICDLTPVRIRDIHRELLMMRAQQVGQIDPIPLCLFTWRVFDDGVGPLGCGQACLAQSAAA